MRNTFLSFLGMVFISTDVVSCGARNTPPDPVTETDLSTVSSPPPTSAAPHIEETAPATADAIQSPRDGAISRQALTAFISEGPAAVLARVTTEPARARGKFIGFRITAFHPEPPKAVDIRVGDIVVAVNGLKIITPEDYFRVFQELNVVSELRFDIIRNNQTLEKIYPVVD